ncbi:DUF2586 family protein [Leptospira brenneri]|uniref:DUF2586 family protein n=1 Tax=Leptospira brenneri TaxID=2023182 RepID=UPI000C2B29A2|nr:DUF2586 family protein [Leptospira brenneri]PJZ43675.1 hypothetical protein CH361_19290 [Leptospira brenneri]
MPIGSVTTTHQSGGLNNADGFEDRIHAKIGEAELGDPDSFKLIFSLQEAKDYFGRGPLVDSLQQHFEEFDEAAGEVPVPVLAGRPANDTVGTIDPPVSAESNTGAAPLPTASGTPTGSRNVVLRVTKAGALGAAEIRKSEDGGVNFAPAVVLPVSGVIALAVGVSATFVNAATPADSFKVGDTWTFVIKAPSASMTSILACVSSLKKLDMADHPFYFVHVLKGVTRAIAVSIGQLLTEMRNEKLFRLFAIVETESKQTAPESETVPAYFQRIQDEWDSFQSENVCVVGAEGRYIGGGIESAGGWNAAKEISETSEVYRNAATFLCARIAAGRVNESAAWVKKNKSRTFIGVRYWNGAYNTYLKPLDNFGLTMLQMYPDERGVFIASDNLMAAADSDFKYIPEMRRKNKLERIIYKTSLPFLKMDTETNSGSGGLDAVKAYCDKAVAEAMEKPGEAEISGHEIVFGKVKKVGNQKVLPATIKMFIRDRLDAIQWTTQFGQVAQ